MIRCQLSPLCSFSCSRQALLGLPMSISRSLVRLRPSLRPHYLKFTTVSLPRRTNSRWMSSNSQKPPNSTQKGDASSSSTRKPGSTPKQGGGGGKHHEQLQHAMEIIGSAESKMMRAAHVESLKVFRGGLATCVLALIWGGAVFGPQFKRFLGGQTAEVARETLGDARLQIETQELAAAVVHSLLNDDEVVTAASLFLRNAATNPSTQDALVRLTNSVLQHPKTLKEVTRLGKEALADLVQDAQVVQDVVSLCLTVLRDKRTLEQAAELAVHVSRAPVIYDAVVELSCRVVQDNRVRDKVTELLEESSHAVLGKEEVIDQGKEFVAEVMADEEVQRQGGDALWQSMQYALQTRLVKYIGMSLVGAALVIVGRSYGGT